MGSHERSGSQRILDGFDTPFFSLDREYRYLGFNVAHAGIMKALYGVDIDLGASLLECQTVAEDRVTAKANVDRTLAGETIVVGAWSGDPGKRRFFTVTHVPLREDGQIVGAAIFALDTTTQEQTRSAGAYNRGLIEASIDPLVAIGLHGAITDVNAATEQATGRSREELIGTDFSDYFTDAESARAAYEQVFRDGSVRDLSLDMVHRDGHPTPVLYNASTFRDEEGGVAGVFAAARDATERRRIEQELASYHEHLEGLVRQRTAELDAFFASALDLLAIAGTDGYFRRLNPQFEAVLGYSLDELEGHSLLEHVHPDDVEATVAATERLAAQRELTEFQNRYQAKDGTYRWVEWRASAHGDTMFATARDITDRKFAEEELRAKNEELERFTYAVSHDLKSPLVTVGTFLGYLEQDRLNQDQERADTDMRYVHAAVQKMTALLDQLLQLSRVGRVVQPSTRVGFATIASDAVSQVAGRLSAGGVETRVSEDPTTFFADRIRLVEVWQNLIDNACKFMGDQASPLIEVGVEPKKGEIVFFVRDNGVGIDPRHQAKVFGMFDKLDPRAEGTGIGLALVKRIVEIYGGRIWIESEGVGRGTTFRFTLPRAVIPTS